MLHMSKVRAAQARPFHYGPSSRQVAANAPPDVGSNLRRHRHQQGHSLETLAKLSGVSRAMLGQIETGKSVPTITLIWKIAKALGIPATDLIAHQTEALKAFIANSEVRTLSASSGRYTVRSYSHADFQQPFEMTEISLAPGHREDMFAKPWGARATLLVTGGVIEVAMGDEQAVRLEKGAAFLFQADIAHSIFNAGPVEATAFLVVAPARLL